MLKLTIIDGKTGDIGNESSKEKIILATIKALKSVNHVRLFQTERGYQSAFCTELKQALNEYGVLNITGILLEAEYQKAGIRHHIIQRPDIVLHIPTEVSGMSVTSDNYAVWAFKRRACASDAQEDFGKLNDMFRILNYQMGFFINIASNQHRLNLMTSTASQYRNRIYTFAVKLNGDGNLAIRQTYWGRVHLIQKNIV